MIKCSACMRWVHDACAGINANQMRWPTCVTCVATSEKYQKKDTHCFLVRQTKALGQHLLTSIITLLRMICVWQSAEV